MAGSREPLSNDTYRQIQSRQIKYSTHQHPIPRHEGSASGLASASRGARTSAWASIGAANTAATTPRNRIALMNCILLELLIFWWLVNSYHYLMALETNQIFDSPTSHTPARRFCIRTRFSLRVVYELTSHQKTKSSSNMQFINVILFLGVVAAVFAAPIEAQAEVLAPREAEASPDAEPSCRGMGCWWVEYLILSRLYLSIRITT